MTLLKKRSHQALAAGVAVVVVAVAVYFVFFNPPGCRNCPTFKYFRLET